MKTTLFLFAFLMIGLFASSQNTQVMSALHKLAIDMHNANIGSDYSTIEGTPYFNKEYSEAIFYQKGSQTVKGNTRLNLYQENFEFAMNDQIYLIDPSTMDSILYNGKIYVYRDVDINGDKKTRAVQKLKQKGNASIYELNQTQLIPEIVAAAYVDPKPARFEPKETVYVLELDSKVIALNSFKNLYNAFPEKSAQLKKFIKQNKIKKDDPEKIEQLVEFLSK